MTLAGVQRPPRNPKSRAISNTMWVSIVIVGVIMTISTLLVMDLGLPAGLIPGSGTLHYAQTMAFTTLVLTQLFNAEVESTAVSSQNLNGLTTSQVMCHCRRSSTGKCAIGFQTTTHGKLVEGAIRAERYVTYDALQAADHGDYPHSLMYETSPNREH
jgi:hypothetical protein